MIGAEPLTAGLTCSRHVPIRRFPCVSN
jgi:hypothetical protein